MIGRPPRSTLFPYPPLSRSPRVGVARLCVSAVLLSECCRAHLRVPLHRLWRVVLPHGADHGPPVEPPGLPEGQERPGRADLFVGVREDGEKELTAFKDLFSKGAEIGRASCRERVQISV